MTRKRLTVPSLGGVVLAGVGLGLLAAPAGWYGESGAAGRQSPSPAVEASIRPTMATIPRGLVTLRVDFKSKGDRPRAKAPTPWDGRLSVSAGSIRQIRLWQEDPRNRVEGDRWTLTTRRVIPWNRQQRARGHDAMPLKDGAIVVELTDVTPDSELDFQTVQGDFSFALKEIEPGAKRSFLGGLVQVSRMANTAIILSAPTEDDYPAAALGPDGALYVAYTAFTHGKDFQKKLAVPEPLEGKDFDILAQPVGGDQVLLLRLDGDKWTAPGAVTPPHSDVYRTAIAVDGSGGVWVFWSANRDDNWDLYARRLHGNRWSKTMRLSTDPGPDTFPTATTDSSGNVWVAWQAFREGSSDILAAGQEGTTFSDPMLVADADANLWTPAVAASSDGRLAVAWDSYENGNYDVFGRVWSGGSFGEKIVIANTPQAEMRPSATFDPAGRLWIAYEESPENWGKDWGALEQTGVALYQQRTVAVRVWAESRLWRPAEDPAVAFQPAGGRQKLAVPRLTIDATGRVWLAVRSPRLGTRTNVGTAWFEHVAWYEGDRWSGEVVVPRTDNILDNRPALVPMPSGKVVMVGSTDGRFTTGSRLPQWFVKTLLKQGEKIKQKPLPSRWPDPVNNELMMAELSGPAGTPRPVRLEPAAPAETAAPSAEAVKEAAEVARARAARVTVGGKTLRLVRGEFHRHTEISSDGGGDGLLMDMWRYGMDVAALDWIGNGDHDNGGGRDYSWWIIQKTTHLFQVPGAFTPMYTYERSCSYPDGHRNVVFDRRGIRTLPRLQGGRGKAMDDLPQEAPRPHTPDTQMLYRYLAYFDGVCASHTSGTDMGTDWRDNDGKVEPIVEIYQGCRQSYEMPGAPRSNTADDSRGGWRPMGFVSLALKKGYRLGFQASSDHISTHISYCNVWVEEPTRKAILAAMKARHVYGATDNIIADVRCGEHFMGDEFSVDSRPSLRIRLIGTQPFAKVHVIKDGNYVHSASPGKKEVQFDWTDFAAKPGRTSYYYVRGEQEDGELVWVSPMWITYGSARK